MLRREKNAIAFAREFNCRWVPWQSKRKIESKTSSLCENVNNRSKRKAILRWKYKVTARWIYCLALKCYGKWILHSANRSLNIVKIFSGSWTKSLTLPSRTMAISIVPNTFRILNNSFVCRCCSGPNSNKLTETNNRNRTNSIMINNSDGDSIVRRTKRKKEKRSKNMVEFIVCGIECHRLVSLSFLFLHLTVSETFGHWNSIFGFVFAFLLHLVCVRPVFEPETNVCPNWINTKIGHSNDAKHRTHWYHHRTSTNTTTSNISKWNMKRISFHLVLVFILPLEKKYEIKCSPRKQTKVKFNLNKIKKKKNANFVRSVWRRRVHDGN